MSCAHPGSVTAQLALPVRLQTSTERKMAQNESAPEHGFKARIGRSVSLDHAVRRLGVSRQTIDNRTREGRLQTIRTLGRSQRVLLASRSVSEQFSRHAIAKPMETLMINSSFAPHRRPLAGLV